MCPPQLPILKSHDRGGSSMYDGVTFEKATNKWNAQIKRMQRHIGEYAHAMKKMLLLTHSCIIQIQGGNWSGI